MTGLLTFELDPTNIAQATLASLIANRLEITGADPAAYPVQ